MARKLKGFKIYPQLYKKQFKVGESMIVKENEKAWIEVNKLNLNKKL